jgi:hypothetical protein
MIVLKYFENEKKSFLKAQKDFEGEITLTSGPTPLLVNLGKGLIMLDLRFATALQ